MSILQRIVEVMEEELNDKQYSLERAIERRNKTQDELTEALKLVAQKETAIVHHMERNNRLFKEIEALKKELGKDVDDGLEGL